MAKAELYIKNGSSWVNYNLLNAYPIGAIYASGNATSPASLFGGSWTQITNAALRGATGVGYTGSDTHKLTIQEMPSPKHAFSHWYYGAAGTNSPVPCNYTSTINKPGTEAGASVGGGRGSTYQRATLLQLLYVATHKVNLKEVMSNGYTSNIL